MSDIEGKVVSLPTRVKRTSDQPLEVVRYGKCQHHHIEVDETKADVKCRDCGDSLNPVWVLARLAQEDSLLMRRWEGMHAEVRALQGRVRTKCEHCDQMTRISYRGTTADMFGRTKREGR